MKTVLVTGSAGFIFSNFMRKVMRENLNYRFVSLDKVIENYNLYNVKRNSDHKFYIADICDRELMSNIFEIEKPNIIIHGAAFSHVDQSIKNADLFVKSNIYGTQVLIDLAVKYNVERFIYISTDEVFGQLQLGENCWNESSLINPRNPYSASKAGGELLVRAAHETHGLRYNITRCCNNYGPCQPPRNLVPKIIKSFLYGGVLPLHDMGKPYREWIYVDDHCSGILTVMEKGIANETYNIGSGFEISNIEMVSKIGEKLGKSMNDIKIDFDIKRPGQDFRYFIDSSKIKSIGWSIENSFEKGIQKTIDWYLQNTFFLEQ